MMFVMSGSEAFALQLMLVPELFSGFCRNAVLLRGSGSRDVVGGCTIAALSPLGRSRFRGGECAGRRPIDLRIFIVPEHLVDGIHFHGIAEGGGDRGGDRCVRSPAGVEAIHGGVGLAKGSDGYYIPPLEVSDMFLRITVVNGRCRSMAIRSVRIQVR